MKTELVRIGNSRGVRIPKPLIEQCGLTKTVELRVADDCLIISPARQPRQDWDDAFLASGDIAHAEKSAADGEGADAHHPARAVRLELYEAILLERRQKPMGG